MTISFNIKNTDGDSRSGFIKTAHGIVNTPVFMPVGTYGAVKGIQPSDLTEIGSEIILSNTYHLMERPGKDIIRELGGLRSFMNWDGPILTDSGGFQVMSLQNMAKIDDDGVTFKSHLDGSLLRLTPKDSINMQNALDSTITMAFDECTPYPVSHDTALKSMNLSMKWAKLCRDNFIDRNGYGLFGIVQGSTFNDLREKSSESLINIGFDGYAIGGLAVGEGHDLMISTLKSSINYLPKEKPRYLMGVGYPKDIIEAVRLGVDMFDCVIPTRSGRTGKIFTKTGTLNIKNARHKNDPRPIEEGCSCKVCSNKVSRAYLHHLFNTNEMLGSIYLTIHNISHYIQLMSNLRSAINDNNFKETSNYLLNQYKKGDIEIYN
ncbi:MAG: tRNA guanosine(34) transglycosylase Tgt [Alphaproteobacteria bacterium]|nr:tRNA guanosine(34) transglycosylase Tgt [Alphaproteobacteria bacterium]|tara:strand:- start:3301 stop:4431 length:1131 start_codon:yes stop_codon:yes gene_type:complete